MVALAGCTASGGGGGGGGGGRGGGADGAEDPTATTTPSPTPWATTMAPTDQGNDESATLHSEEVTTKEETTTCDERSETDRLPEPSPLANPLPDLVESKDREAFAERHGLDYRDGRVTVYIELEPDGEAPTQYLGDDYSGHQDTIVACVAVEDLVDLALDDDVRIVRQHHEPVTHDGSPE